MIRNTSDISITDIQLAGEKIILIGGLGFIGHHLGLELKARGGAEVVIVDHLQVNNIIKVLSDVTLDEKRRMLYTTFILDRFSLLRDRGIEIVLC